MKHDFCAKCNKMIKSKEFKKRFYPDTDLIHKNLFMHLNCWTRNVKIEQNDNK